MKEIYLREFTTVIELVELLDVPANRIVGAAFHNLGLLVTIHEPIEFQQARVLAAEFGFMARRIDS